LAYVKTVWSTGDTITATLTNHLETQYDESKVDLDAHKAEAMPHRFVDGLSTYRYGFKLNATSDGLIFVYEEVI
jgi:hypothetical protein